MLLEEELDVSKKIPPEITVAAANGRIPDSTTMAATANLECVGGGFDGVLSTEVNKPSNESLGVVWMVRNFDGWVPMSAIARD